MDEDTAIVILEVNLKKRRRKHDPLTVAEAAQFLVDCYGSAQAVGETVGVSDSTIQIWLKLASLVGEFQELIRRKEVAPVAAYRIASAFPDPRTQLEVARAVACWEGAGEKEVAAVIRHKKRNPGKTVAECQEWVEQQARRQLLGWGSESTRRQRE